MSRCQRGEQTIQFLLARGRLETVEAVSLVEASEAFAKSTFEHLRRTRHSVQYFDPDAAPISELDVKWAIDKAADAVSGARALLSRQVLERFA